MDIHCVWFTSVIRKISTFDLQREGDSDGSDVPSGKRLKTYKLVTNNDSQSHPVNVSSRALALKHVQIKSIVFAATVELM